MKTLMIAVALTALVSAGCASKAPHPSGTAHEGTLSEQIGKSEPVVKPEIQSFNCRVPCTISPGPGCC